MTPARFKSLLALALIFGPTPATLRIVSYAISETPLPFPAGATSACLICWSFALFLLWRNAREEREDARAIK